MAKKFPKGFDCLSCSAPQSFTPWVAAHWYEILTHTCQTCGAKHSVLAGNASLIKKGRKLK